MGTRTERAAGGETNMKKKWVAGLILAMVLTALAAAAPAEPLTCR